MMFDYIIITRTYGISDKQYNPDIGHLSVSINSQAVAGQSNPHRLTYIT